VKIGFGFLKLRHCVCVLHTRVEVSSWVESSAIDSRREAITADGLGDIGVKITVKSEIREKTKHQYTPFLPVIIRK